VFLSARREALIAALVLVTAGAYSLIYCYNFGYGREPESLTFVLWFPDWVLWGIVAPWTACTLFATWFAFRVMRDEDLGGDDDPGDESADDQRGPESAHE
jgi:hypothetical protein